MLVPKKIEKTRLIVYFVVMGIMLCATLFLIFKNLKGTKKEQQNPVVVSPSTNVIVDTAKDTKKDETLKILHDSRFQSLHEGNIESSASKNIGKKNPFKPE